MLCACSESNKVDVTYAWNSSTEGSPSVRYEFQANINDGGWKTVSKTVAKELYTLSVDQGDSVQVRVRAYDRLNRNSTWSPASERYFIDRRL